MRKLTLILLALALSGAARADRFYTATLDTSAIAGTTGSVDVALYPGPGITQAASLLITNFSGASFAGLKQSTGNAGGGPLGSAPVFLDAVPSGYQSNDEFESVTFGRSLSFALDFGSNAVNFPDSTGTSPIEFAFYVYADAAGTKPVLTPDPSGLAGTISIAPNGSFTTAILSPNLAFTNTPEPATFGLIGAALASLCLFRKRFTGF